MDRKDFLRKSALLSLAAAGVTKFSRAASPAAIVTYKSARLKTSSRKYVEYAISNVNTEELLDSEKSFSMNITITIKQYKDATVSYPTSTEEFSFVRKSAPKKEVNGQVIKFAFNRNSTDKNKEIPLPQKIKLIYFNSGEKISLETGKNSYTTLSREKGSSDSDGCYLTTACTKARGMADDCEELQTLRMFRDNYMKPNATGKKLIQEYYHIAPLIVSNINSRSNASAIWDKVYADLVIESKTLIDNNECKEAQQLYTDYARWLEEIFVKN